MANPLDLKDLKPQFRGQLLTPADGDSHVHAKRVFNAMHDHHNPALIARATGVADVVAAVKFAREHHLTVAVRGGGHSVAGYSNIDGGMVIDLGPMKGVRVDARQRRARAQGGLTWGEFDRETQVYGLATTGGRVTSTGLAGFTLGSGSGWLERLVGLSCDNLISADVVTAQGKVLTASAEENEDLFWGLRGGGGNFGIVTDFEYRLHPVGPIVLGGILLYPIAQAAKALQNFRDFMATAPREVGAAVSLMTAPPAPHIPPPLKGKPAAAIVVAWFGDPKRGAEVLAPLRAFGPPVLDAIRPMPYVVFQSLLDPGMPKGNRNYWRSDNLKGLPNEAIDTLIGRCEGTSSPMAQLIVAPLGGAISDVAEDAMAISGRAAQWQYHCYGVWPQGDDARHLEWVRGTEKAMRPFAEDGISMNFVSEPGNAQVRAGFGDAKYRKLVAIKDKYDPENFFRLNQNIVPSGQKS